MGNETIRVNKTITRLLLQKVEELTLYVIDLQKQIKGLKNK